MAFTRRLNRREALVLGTAGLGLSGWIAFSPAAPPAAGGSFPVTHSEAEWQRLLTSAQFAILRRQGTEWPGSSPLDHEIRPGRYACAGCAQPAFSSAQKFDSHTGWPSFWAALPGRVATATDTSLLLPRTEVHCSTCGGHLGHLFDDGPKPTGLRYCINGAALDFQPESQSPGEKS